MDDAMLENLSAKEGLMDQSGSTINNVQVSIEAFLGGGTMSIRELQSLGLKDVVDLDAPLNESVDLKVNGVTVAQGYLVAVGDKFGVKITTLAE